MGFSGVYSQAPELVRGYFRIFPQISHPYGSVFSTAHPKHLDTSPAAPKPLTNTLIYAVWLRNLKNTSAYPRRAVSSDAIRLFRLVSRLLRWRLDDQAQIEIMNLRCASGVFD